MSKKENRRKKGTKKETAKLNEHRRTKEIQKKERKREQETGDDKAMSRNSNMRIAEKAKEKRKRPYYGL